MMPPHTPGRKKPNHSWPPAALGLTGSTSKLPNFQWHAVVLSSNSGRSVLWLLLSQPVSFPARVMKRIIRALHMPDASAGLTLFDWQGVGGIIRAQCERAGAAGRSWVMCTLTIFQVTRVAKLLVNAKGKSGLYCPFMKPLMSFPRNYTLAIINIQHTVIWYQGHFIQGKQ